MNLFEQIREKSARMAQMLEAGVAVQRELTVLIDEVNGKLGPIVALFNAPQAAVLAAAARAGGPSAGRRGRKARAVSFDTAAPAVNGAPLVRKTKKGAAFGKSDVAEMLGDGIPRTRDELAEALKARGVKMPIGAIKQKLAVMLSPSNSKGLFVRQGSKGAFTLGKITPCNKDRGPESAPKGRGKGSHKRPASGSKPRRRVGRDEGSPVFVGSRRDELGQILVERLTGQTKSVGQLANDIAPMFPLAGKREVCDAIGELLGEDDRFVMTSSGDWRLA